MIELTVPNEQAGERLDRYLARALPQFSRSRLQALIEAGDALLNGEKARRRETVRAGDVVRLVEPAVEEIEDKAEEIPLAILFEDDDLLVLNKPAGLVVHPGAGNQTHTLVNALLHHCTEPFRHRRASSGPALSIASTKKRAAASWWQKTTPPTRNWRASSPSGK